ncbi:MAG: hypothetical protein JST79_05340 [Acidobacteria bacterium]|nr:hypothetical protein [Acidobacteriota bacterium]
MKTKFLLLICVLYLVWAGGLSAWAGSRTIFQIGKQDRSFQEFGLEQDSEHILYRAGQSLPGKDWRAYQPGAYDDFLKNPKGVPFQVNFSLDEEPKGKFILRLDTIVRQMRPGAPRYVVEINGKTGSYQLNPQPAPELWWPTGGYNYVEYIGYQATDMVLPASYFRRGENTLVLRVDGFGIFYDDLSLINEPDATAKLIVDASVQPTILYKKSSAGLVELANVTVRTSGPLDSTKLKLVVGGMEFTKEISQPSFGDAEIVVEVPAPERAVPTALYLAGAGKPLVKTTFQPKRRWLVYADPREQADFGYDDTPAMTLSWEDQFTDRFLELVKQFPSYSFTLDTSSNLQSYLKNRDPQHKKELLDHLRSGKVGMNALWTNFFTGLASPEELFQTVDYGLRAGKEHGFTVDQASQTDEPSVAWGLAQVLAESGVKYFTHGSDPIHGPLNPIGLLNFQSPYYWETPNGSKLLVWNSVSYDVVRDMTWEGWDPEDAQHDVYDPDSRVGCWLICEDLRTSQYSPSLFGLRHSLPLFLSQYERQDYPFDAVYLYGLYPDEFPIVQFGSADIIERWNREYEYPKVIPGTQRDYFRHITDHFASQIKTYRGDGGAYWEDESGADARVSALNRTSQVQAVAAEKLDSIASWFQPHVRRNEAAFRQAWENIMLTDVYVWSSAGSWKPTADVTQISEDVHRGWAGDAHRQTRDLLMVAMDKVGQSIDTQHKRGVVVFNTDNQPRSGLLDWDLNTGETLQNAATGQPLPCSLLNPTEKYWKVRCWIDEIPTMGYKFYPIVRGNVAPGKPETTDPWAAVENRYYKMQLDRSTGAIRQLIDKETGQNLVNLSSGYGLNEYLYVTGGGDDTPLYVADPTLKLPTLTAHQATVIGTPVVTHFPWGIQVSVHSKAENTPNIVTTITLNHGQKRVVIQNEVEKTTTLAKEGVYFAFPFAVDKPQVGIQGATAWVNPETDLLPGAGRQSFVTRGGVRIQGTNQSIGWVSVDAPLLTLGDINRGLWPSSITIRNGSVFSYVMNNYWEQDTPVQQGGNFTFRYVLTSGKDLPLAAMGNLTEEARTPLYAIRHSHKNWEQPLSAKGASFLAASEGVAVLTIRPTADDRSYLIRVQNTTDQPLNAHLNFPLVQLEDAYLGSVLGDKVDSVQWDGHGIDLAMKKNDIKTVVVRVQDKPPQASDKN